MVSDTILIMGIMFTFAIIAALIIISLMLMFNSAHAAVVNSTADVKVPLQVTVGGQQDNTVGKAAPTALDTTSLLASASAIIGLAARWRKSDKHEDRFDARTTTSAQTQAQTAESLKQTDKGIEELLGSLSSVVNVIPGIPPEAKKLIEDQMNGWKKDNEAYYVNTPAKPTDLSKDTVVKKLGEIQKITEKNP